MNKQKAEDEQYRARVEEIKNYQPTQPSNPQQEEETAEEAEARQLREKFLKEVEAVGEEQVKLMEARMSKYADLDKQLAELNARLEEGAQDDTE